MDVSPWLEFGWPVALLVLILTGLGVGLSWFLKAYLKQQKEEFQARRKEQDRKDNLLMEQHEFIRDLATSAISEAAAALTQTAEIRGFMQEMIRSLAIINEQLHDHAVQSKAARKALKEQNQGLLTQVGQLERTAFKMHKGE
ncbi:MAG: hypothetical protein ACXAEN_14320 [Candidatus Thorarchaeota archaeon]|jgi:hypothetical protein